MSNTLTGLSGVHEGESWPGPSRCLGIALPTGAKLGTQGDQGVEENHYQINSYLGIFTLSNEVAILQGLS